MLRLSLIILFLWPFQVQAQAHTKKLTPYFQFDSYYSFIGNKSADVFGFKAGVEWNKKWRFAAGYNKIQSDIVEYKEVPAAELPYADGPIEKAQLYLQYFPVMTEYVFYREDPWQLSVPFCLGYGRSYFQYYGKEEERRVIFRHGVLVADPGVYAQYKVLPWVGIGVGLGYRLMLINNPEIDTRFNSPIFSFRIKLFPGELYRTIFKQQS